jgi:hypothetical protein
MTHVFVIFFVELFFLYLYYIYKFIICYLNNKCKIQHMFIHKHILCICIYIYIFITFKQTFYFNSQISNIISIDLKYKLNKITNKKEIKERHTFLIK